MIGKTRERNACTIGWQLGIGTGVGDIWSLGSEYTLLDIFTLLHVYIGDTLWI
jgi:hypothetical protein